VIVTFCFLFIHVPDRYAEFLPNGEQHADEERWDVGAVAQIVLALAMTCRLSFDRPKFARRIRAGHPLV